jgi:ATP-dependent Zn protease
MKSMLWDVTAERLGGGHDEREQTLKQVAR